MIRYAEPKINILLTRNLPFNSDVRNDTIELFVGYIVEVNFSLTRVNFAFVLISFVHFYGAVVP